MSCESESASSTSSPRDNVCNRDLVCCNVMLAEFNGKRTTLINDIVTGKALEYVYKDIPHDKLRFSVDSTIEMCINTGQNIPSSMMFIGNCHETDSSIVCDWSQGSPVFAATQSFAFACYVRARQIDGKSQLAFFERLSDKAILFQGLESNCNLMNSIQTFGSMAVASGNYDRGKKPLILVCNAAEHRSDGIFIDVNTVYKFGDKDIIYNSLRDGLMDSVSF